MVLSPKILFTSSNSLYILWPHTHTHTHTRFWRFSLGLDSVASVHQLPGHSKKETSLPAIHFQVRAVSLREGSHLNSQFSSIQMLSWASDHRNCNLPPLRRCPVFSISTNRPIPLSHGPIAHRRMLQTCSFATGTHPGK